LSYTRELYELSYATDTPALEATAALRPTGGLMLRRDRDGRLWATEGEMLTHFARVVKNDHPRRRSPQ
jgi:hypothetical protein